MDDQSEYLITFSNLKLDLFKHQTTFLSEKDLFKFYKNDYMGVPLCLPIGIKYFDYSSANFFKINKKYFANKIFKTDNINYIGVKKYFRYGDMFATNVFLKKKYKYHFYTLVKKNKLLIKKIKDLKKKKIKICSMQIRNIPHFGHEAIFKFLIQKFDLLVLNPIFGIKKKGDFSDQDITKALSYIEKKYFKIKFLPVFSSFHYAGPREAIHHLSLRESLGFNYFYVGRDHAGAESLYNSNQAIRMVNKYKDKFKIKTVTSGGGYYCDKCKEYVVKNKCHHSNLINISGTELRSFIKQKKFYNHADKYLQQEIFSK
jgi:sulfate adenylyltransferase